MKVVILCGGMGTRLREETEFRPKPLVEIGGKPILWHIMKIYSHYGFKEFVLCLGYKGHLIKEYFLDYRVMQSDFTLRLDSPEHPHFHHRSDPIDWTITFAETGADAMTGARVKRVEKYIQEDSFLLTYGDGLADIDVGKLLEFHRGHGRIATVTGVRSNSRYGELSVLEGRVKRFSEKPQVEEGFISGGFFVFQRRLFDYLSDDDGCVLELAPLETLAQEGQLMSYLHPGYWRCMDTYRDFITLNDAWRQGAPWKVWK
ncbi:MAG TPA: glucose-1-phosphate cytidylyltransferase [Terriglobia bacterium]|nr:glucose-1-phosphate cytidylyltransferase [Terriglobia bacterium]